MTRGLPMLAVALALALTLALTLSACSVAPVAAPRAVYDLGPAPAPAANPAQPSNPANATTVNATTVGPLAWRSAEVTAPPWLQGDGMAYRLAFQQAQRLEHYRDSFWAAPPAALLSQRLRERLTPAPGCAGRTPALLTLSLDEFEQVFRSPTDSVVVLRFQATLASGGSGSPVAQQRWRLERPAPSPDAVGAAQGLAQAIDLDLIPELAGWLAAQTPACR